MLRKRLHILETKQSRRVLFDSCGHEHVRTSSSSFSSASVQVILPNAPGKALWPFQPLRQSVQYRCLLLPGAGASVHLRLHLRVCSPAVRPAREAQFKQFRPCPFPAAALMGNSCWQARQQKNPFHCRCFCCFTSFWHCRHVIHKGGIVTI